MINPSLEHVPTTMRVPNRHQLADGIAVHAAQGISTSRFGKVTCITKLFAVHVDNRVARMHQRESMGHIVQRSRTKFVMTPYKQHARRTVVQAIVMNIQQRIANILPGVRRPHAAQIVTHRKER